MLNLINKNCYKKVLLVTSIIMFVFSINAFANTFDEIEEVIETEYGTIEVYKEVENQDEAVNNRFLSTAFDTSTGMAHSKGRDTESPIEKAYLSSCYYWKLGRGVANEITIRNNTPTELTFQYRLRKNVEGTPTFLRNDKSDEVYLNITVSPNSEKTFGHNDGSEDVAGYLSVNSPINASSHTHTIGYKHSIK